MEDTRVDTDEFVEGAVTNSELSILNGTNGQNIKVYKIDLLTAAGIAVTQISEQVDNCVYAHVDYNEQGDLIGVEYGIKHNLMEQETAQNTD